MASGAQGAVSAEDGAAGSDARRWQAGNHVGDQPGDEDNTTPSSPPARAPPDHLPRGSPAGLRPFSRSFCPPSFLVTHTDWHGWDMCMLHP